MKKNCNCDETEVCEVCAKNGCVTAEEKRTLRIEWVDTRASLTPYHKDLIHFQMQEYANEYANAKLLEVLETETRSAYIKAHTKLFKAFTPILNQAGIKQRQEVDVFDEGTEYFETQVKPKYNKLCNSTKKQ